MLRYRKGEEMKPNTKERGWKNKYRAIKYKGYEWGGWDADAGLHFFQKGNYRGGFTVVRCKEEELWDKSEISGNSSFQLLVDYGHTR